MSVVVIGLCGEDEGHYVAVTRLVDDELVASHAWLDGVLDACRSWGGASDGERWYKYDPADAKDLRPVEHDGVTIPLHGHIDGAPQKPEAGMWRKVLLRFCHAEPRPQAVVLARDLDGYPERRAGMEQVRSGEKDSFTIEKRFLLPDGETVWVINSCQRMDYPDGRVEFLYTAVDITERKKAEARLENTHRKLLETSRQAGMAKWPPQCCITSAMCSTASTSPQP